MCVAYLSPRPNTPSGSTSPTPQERPPPRSPPTQATHPDPWRVWTPPDGRLGRVMGLESDFQVAQREDFQGRSGCHVWLATSHEGLRILLNANVVVEFIHDTRGLCIWVVLGVLSISWPETILLVNSYSHPTHLHPPPNHFRTVCTTNIIKRSPVFCSTLN